jgi:hypothetical protein
MYPQMVQIALVRWTDRKFHHSMPHSRKKVYLHHSCYKTKSGLDSLCMHNRTAERCEGQHWHTVQEEISGCQQ